MSIRSNEILIVVIRIRSFFFSFLFLQYSFEILSNKRIIRGEGSDFYESTEEKSVFSLVDRSKWIVRKYSRGMLRTKLAKTLSVGKQE